ncbi:hypothetical protein AAE478_008253 [Parahypoxylon ruwenzoriense]
MAPPPSSSVEDVLRADIELQEVLLDSLKDNPDDAPERVSELKAVLKDLKRQLHQYLSKPQKDSQAYSKSAKPFKMSNRSSDSWESQQEALPTNRKRTFSTHIGSGPAPPSPANKSRRATPSPSPGFDNFRPPNVTQEDWLRGQREAVLSFHEKKQQEDKDAAVARQLNDEFNKLPSMSSPLPPLGFSSTIPSHIKSESLVGPRVNESPSFGNYSMPGDFFSDTDDIFGDGLLNFNIQPQQSPTDAESSVQTPLTVHSPHNPASSAAENAREAALRRHQLDKHHNSSALTTPTHRSSDLSLDSMQSQSLIYDASESRPEMLPTSTASHLGYSTPERSGDNPGSLEDILKRTAGYDYVRGVDEFGDPLPQRMKDYLNDTLDESGNEDNGVQDEGQIRNLLANIQQDTRVSEEDQDNTPEALRYPLYKHQQVALRWMERMELDDNKKGGILADDMGLGKTLSTMALMVSRKAKRPLSSGERYFKTNLIVAPLSLLKQWQREIEQKLKPQLGLTVFMLHGRKANYDQLRNYDVVLTTYGRLASEFGKMDNYIREAESKNEVVDNDRLSQIFPLIGPRSFFYRIILDEAQFIKNYNTKTAKGASHLKGQYRWCLSGTPMMNGPKELASLVHFLKIKPYCQFDLFNRTFKCLNPNSADSSYGKTMALKKLQALLRAIMLRRTKNSKLDGEPIIQLKEKIEVVDYVIFDEDELQYYKSLEKNSRVEFSKYLRAGTIGRHYAQVLVLLLRLRQACCHPYLHITDLEFVNPGISEDTMVKSARYLAPDAIERIKEIEAFDCPVCLDGVEDPSIMSPCGHYLCPGCLTGLINSLAQQNIQAGQDNGSIQCPACRGSVDTTKVINYEVFKKVYMPEKVEEIEDDDEFTSDSDDDSIASGWGDSGDDIDECGNLKGFVVNDDDEEEEEDDDYDGTRTSRGLGSRNKKGKSTKLVPKPKSKRKKDDEVQPHMLKQLRKNANQNHKAHRRYMRYLRQIWLPSAKVTKCCEIVSNIHNKTDEKIIIFSQWTILLDLLEIAIKTQLNLGIRRYDGSMSATQRDNAAQNFTEDPEVKVILVSLKAGNAGLNLTAASQVIIMDPFWNPYTEMQAIDRTYRIGQQRNVTVHRILTQETVEDRIIAIQEKKRALVDSALSEKAAKDIGRLSANDLAYLFGVRASGP